MKFYAIAFLVKGKEEYMVEESGDDCFSGDLSNAILFNSKSEMPPLLDGEYVVVVRQSDEGFMYRY